MLQKKKSMYLLQCSRYLFPCCLLVGVRPFPGFLPPFAQSQAEETCLPYCLLVITKQHHISLHLTTPDPLSIRFDTDTVRFATARVCLPNDFRSNWYPG